MADVIIVGDGPGGLSAALFLAKRGLDTVVLGQDATPMHQAMLYNYLGVPEMTGSDFQALARRQVAAQGARLEAAEATAVERDGDGFTVTTADGARHGGRYLILASGRKRQLGVDLGLETGDKGSLVADRDGRTAIDRLYVVGWTTRPDKVQAIISAGDGAAAALDILSREAGKQVHDFDAVEKSS